MSLLKLKVQWVFMLFDLIQILEKRISIFFWFDINGLPIEWLIRLEPQNVYLGWILIVRMLNKIMFHKLAFRRSGSLKVKVKIKPTSPASIDMNQFSTKFFCNLMRNTQAKTMAFRILGWTQYFVPWLKVWVKKFFPVCWVYSWTFVNHRDNKSRV
jgi:hypothetical protein